MDKNVLLDILEPPQLSKKYSTGGDLKDVEEQQMEYDHELNMRQLQYGFSQLKVADDAKDTRTPHQKRIKMTLNVGAFIRKVVRNGADKTMSTYWTYMGSLTTPSENKFLSI